MATIQRGFTHPRVFTRAAWSEDWVERPDIFVRTVEFSLTSIGKAILFYPYGAVMHGTANEYDQRTPYNLHDHFCKIEIYPTDPTAKTILWYGVFVVDDLDSHGSHASKMSGNQTLTAYALEYLLTRIQVVTTMVAPASSLDNFTRVRTAATFNGFKSDRSGNRVQSNNKQESAELFANGFAAAEPWSSEDIARYLLRYVAEGTGVNLIPGMTLTLSSAGHNYEPDEIPATGQTIYSLLNAVFTPTRGLAWKLEPSATVDGTVFLKTLSISDVDVILPDDTRIAAASSQKTIEAYNDLELDVCQITSDKATKYDRVIVEGAPFGSVFTLQLNEELEPDWDDLETTLYRVAAVGEDGFAAADKSEQKSRNDAVRSSEPLSHVFARYRINRSWLGQLQGNSEAFPEPATDGEYDPNYGLYTDHSVRQKLWLDTMRFLPYLPLNTQTDYAKNTPEARLKPDSLPDFRRPFLVAQLHEKGEAKEKYVDLSEALQVTADDEGMPVEVAATIEMQEHQLGVLIRPNKPPHCLQRQYLFDGTDAPTQSSHWIAGTNNPLDNKKMWCTVYCQSPNNVVVWAPDEAPPAGPFTSELVIRLGERARVDLLAKSTIVGVKDFKLQKNPKAVVLRDDRPKMRAIAQRAWAYYSRYRNMLSLRYKAIHNELELGDLITRIQLGSPQFVGTGNNAFLATTAGATPDTITNELLVTGDGAVLLFNGIPAATGNQTVTPGTALPGQRFITIDETNQEVNTIVSRIVYNCIAGTTEIQTQFSELAFA